MIFFIGILALLAVIAAAISFKLRKLTVVKREVVSTGRFGDKQYENRTAVDRKPSIIAGAIAAVLAVIAGALLAGSMFYTQDPGEAKVLRDWAGNVVGQDVDPGLGTKAPWVSTIDYNIRNQAVSFIGNGQDTYNGQTPTGPQITTSDKEGVQVNVDLAVMYSIKADAVTDIYNQHKTQEAFSKNVIEQDIRSVARRVPGNFTTAEFKSSRDEASQQIFDALQDRWEAKGVVIEQVNLQEIRYSAEVEARFDSAQQARIGNETAKANLETARIDAQQKVVQAQAEAEANRIVAESITPELLERQRTDALVKIGESGNLIVVPEGGNTLLNLPTPSK